jgi:hypothetical protein
MATEEEMVGELRNAHTGEDLEGHCWHGAALLKAYKQLEITARTALEIVERVEDATSRVIAKQLKKDLKALQKVRDEWSE